MPVALFHYCPACGEAPIGHLPPREYHCGQCGYHFFFNAAAAAGAIITCGNELLLGVRKRPPAEGQWDFVGGFIDFEETAEEGLAREIREELGITVAEDQLTYVCSQPNTYLFDGVTYNTLDLLFVCDFAEKPGVTPADDLAGVVWVPIDRVDEAKLAFRSTRAALERFRQR
ncbi:MAG: NUDIX domain-containing protein [Phycisphaerae bacterium]|jgi:ADP-ribose pyrophosphatase YjhB (NUDIX family)|nr:NUDIX domain-containing protein [Phycisphaerae bacterium]